MLLVRVFALLGLLATLCSAQVTEVTDGNVGSLVGKQDEWLLEFYADWCGYCRKFAPKYEAVQRVLASSPTSHDVRVGKVNVDTNPGLAARFFIQRLPTIMHIKDHQVRVIPADRMNDLVSIVEDQSWNEIKPASGITSPFSAIGTIMAYTGMMFKYASSLSPVTVVILMIILVAVVVILPIYMPGSAELEKEKEQEKKEQEVQQKEAERQAKEAAKSSAKAESSTESKQRRSKRID